jgi:hypothetical protein
MHVIKHTNYKLKNFKQTEHWNAKYHMDVHNFLLNNEIYDKINYLLKNFYIMYMEF